MNYYTIEIEVSERYIVQVVVDDRGNPVAVRLFDTYTNDEAPRGAVARATLRDAVKQAVGYA